MSRLKTTGPAVAFAATVTALAVGAPAVAWAVRPPESILGEWVTQREENRPPGRVKFVQALDGTYEGILTWSEQPKKDVNNKDPKLRDRPLVGIVLMWHLKYDDGRYVDGYVYNPEDGGTYRVKAEVLSPQALEIRGYLGISLFGQSKTWARYNQ